MCIIAECVFWQRKPPYSHIQTAIDAYARHPMRKVVVQETKRAYGLWEGPSEAMLNALLSIISVHRLRVCSDSNFILN